MRTPIARIRQLAGTDRGGTTLTGMIEAAKRLGFSASGIRAPIEVLEAVPKPAVAHLANAQGRTHFVVLYAATARGVVVMDPAYGEVRHLTSEEFQGTWSGVLLLLAPEETEPPQTPTSSVGRFWRLARPHRTGMLRAAVGAIAYTLLGLSTAIFVQKIVDYVIPDGNRDLLDLLGMTMLVLAVSQIYLGCTKDALVLRTGQKIDAGLIFGYYQHLLRLPQRFFDTMRVGEIVSRVNDAVKIREFINETSLELLVNLLVVTFSFALMFAYSWELALMVGASIPIYLLVYWATNRANRANQRRTMEATAELEAHLVESIGAATTIRRLGLEGHSARGTETRLVRVLRPVYAVGLTSVLSAGAAELVSRVTTVGLLWLGTVMVLRQTLTPGELMSFYALNGHLTGPVLGLIAANRRVQDALVAADRLFDILDLEREGDTGSIELRPTSASEAIGFRRVCFRYGTRPPLFDGLSLGIPRGSFTALVGESGSGKSTFAALLQRLYTPESGQILIGGMDIRHVRRDSLLRTVAVVPQDAILLTGSILENLAPGEHAPDLANIEAVCERVGIREFVDGLPAGFATPLGERGVDLSGGQRQRLAIARALYRQPNVVVLDEATSGLDATTENLIYQELRRLQSDGLTVIVITHRLTTAMHADRIIVLAHGKLVEQGTHRELVERTGIYQRLWLHQTAGVSTSQGPAGPPQAPPRTRGAVALTGDAIPR